jgi:hypothetical protein
MNTKNRISRWLGSSLLCITVTCDANDEFQQWMQQQAEGVNAQKKEFQEYKDKRDKEFTAFLKAHWKAVDIVKGEVRDEAPKPDVMPVAPVEIPVTAQKGPEQMPPVSIAMPETVVPVEPAPAPVVMVPKGNQVKIDFYGKQLNFYFDAGMKIRLNARIDKESISDYWSRLSRTDYDDLMMQLNAQKKSLQLNDWGYASLIHKLAAEINTSRRNESALLSWFLLAKSGYRARIAYNDSSVFLLVPSKQEMFEVSYFTFGGRRYYAVEFDGDRQQPGQVYTYDGEYPDAIKELDMQLTAAVASSDQAERRHLSFEFEGKRYNIDVTYDRGRVKFLGTYPQLNLDQYFGAGVYRPTATPLLEQLAGNMRGMSEQQAVNFLLRFVQTALQYETDDKQFGKENYLFPEETLYYPYSDCEDRAVLFAWLVKSLLNLDVIGLDYPGHVAAAVHFSQSMPGDSISYQGKRYTVTDPTYINAVAGMTMPAFRQFKPAVIAY